MAAAVPIGSAGQSEDLALRVFVHSSDPAVRGEAGVRHDFGPFFSSNVPSALAEKYRARGIAVEEVPVHEVLCHKGQHPCNGGARAVPNDPTPYGLELLYGNASLTSTSGGSGLRVGHLDTGIDTDHPDLVRRIAVCLSTVGGSCEDANGHGTHTAGTVAADAGADGRGIWGVAPEASLHTYKVCGKSGFCYVDDTLAALDGCIAAGCHVITFSIGGDSPSSAERSRIAAFNAAGGLFVAAAGNDGPGVCTLDYPAAFKEVLSVAALDAAKRVADFSSRGCTADADASDEDGELDFAAAGVGVESTSKGNGYKVLSGTSMATPHVAGLAAKKWAGDRAATLAALENGVEDLGATGLDIHTGRGLPHV